PDVAPHGWVRDRKSKEWRPRKRAGRRADPERQLAAAAEDPDVAPDWVDRDPEPARLVDGDAGARPAPAQRPEPPSKEVVDDIAAMGGFVGVMLLPGLMRLDPHCGGALADNWDRVVGAAIPLICRSERVVQWVTGTSGLRLWLGLAVALKPVGTAIVQHHI